MIWIGSLLEQWPNTLLPLKEATVNKVEFFIHWWLAKIRDNVVLVRMRIRLD